MMPVAARGTTRCRGRDLGFSMSLKQCREHELRALLEYDVTHSCDRIDDDISDLTRKQNQLFLGWRRIRERILQLERDEGVCLTVT